MFPSPRGDKLCQKLDTMMKKLQSFRPLAGISCVATSAAASKAAGEVSVPSRG